MATGWKSVRRLKILPISITASWVSTTPLSTAWRRFIRACRAGSRCTSTIVFDRDPSRPDRGAFSEIQLRVVAEQVLVVICQPSARGGVERNAWPLKHLLIE